MADDIKLTGRPRGRPRAPEPRVSISTWVPVSQYERILQQANQQELTLSKYVKEALNTFISSTK